MLLPMPEFPTQRDIARRAKVSQAAVSMALRGHSSVSPKQRRRILEIAQQMGYQLDPVISTTMRGLKNRERPDIRGNLGVLVAGSSSGSQEPSERLILEGLRQRAAHSRFALEEVSLAHCDAMDAARLREIFHARGCQGLIVVERQRTLESVSQHRITMSGMIGEMPMLVVGRSTPEPEVASLSIDWKHAAHLAIRKILTAGWQRPGLLISDTRLYGDVLAGFLSAQALLIPQANRVAPLRHYLGVTNLDAVLEWISQGKVDCLLAHESILASYQEELARHLPIVCFDIAEETSAWPGISVPWKSLGEQAIDDLVTRILFTRNNATGQTLIRGQWHPLRQLEPPPAPQGIHSLNLPETHLTPLNPGQGWISALGPPAVPASLNSGGVPFQLSRMSGDQLGYLSPEPEAEPLSLVIPAGISALHILHACSYATNNPLVAELSICQGDKSRYSQSIKALGIPTPGQAALAPNSPDTLIQDWWPSYPVLGNSRVQPVNIPASLAVPFAGFLYHFRWSLPTTSQEPCQLQITSPADSQSRYAVLAITCVIEPRSHLTPAR